MGMIATLRNLTEFHGGRLFRGLFDHWPAVLCPAQLANGVGGRAALRLVVEVEAEPIFFVLLKNPRMTGTDEDVFRAQQLRSSAHQQILARAVKIRTGDKLQALEKPRSSPFGCKRREGDSDAFRRMLSANWCCLVSGDAR